MNKQQLNPEDVFLVFVEEAELHGEPGALARTAKRLSVPRSTVTRMAARYRFSQRYNGPVAEKIQEQTNQIAATSAAEYRKLQAQVGTELVQKAMETLRRAPIESVRDAVMALKQGDAMAQAATQPKQTQVNVDVVHVLKQRFEEFVSVPAPARRIQVDFGSLDDDLKEGNGDE
jgi:hypothetical protein